jgi:hypothetical protein
VTTITKPLVFAALAVAAFILVYPQIRDRLPQAMDFTDNRSPRAAESASQLSSAEFEEIASGFTPDRLRAFAGEPAAKTKASVEGVTLECWYYGIAGEQGTYQVCFENERLSAKLRFSRDA